MTRFTLALVLIPLLSGCFMGRTTRHRPLDGQAIAALQPGVATATDVVTALGAPTEVVQLGHRSDYRYDYGQQKQTGLVLIVLGLYGLDSQEDRAWFFFDENNLLTHVGATLNGDTAKYSLPGF